MSLGKSPPSSKSTGPSEAKLRSPRGRAIRAPTCACTAFPRKCWPGKTTPASASRESASLGLRPVSTYRRRRRMPVSNSIPADRRQWLLRAKSLARPTLLAQTSAMLSPKPRTRFPQLDRSEAAATNPAKLMALSLTWMAAGFFQPPTETRAHRRGANVASSSGGTLCPPKRTAPPARPPVATAIALASAAIRSACDSTSRAAALRRRAAKARGARCTEASASRRRRSSSSTAASMTKSKGCRYAASSADCAAGRVGGEGRAFSSRNRQRSSTHEAARNSSRVQRALWRAYPRKEASEQKASRASTAAKSCSTKGMRAATKANSARTNSSKRPIPSK